MRKVTLFIAMSLDGYIADREGNVDWLGGQESGPDDMGSYQEFIREIDTVIMGWNTYHQIATELSPEKWACHGLESYVATHREIPSTEEIQFTQENVNEKMHAEQSSGHFVHKFCKILAAAHRVRCAECYVIL